MRPPLGANAIIVFIFGALYKMPITRIVVVIGALGWMRNVARLVRGSFLEARNLQYVESARVLGGATPRIMFRHILPNAPAPSSSPPPCGSAKRSSPNRP